MPSRERVDSIELDPPIRNVNHKSSARNRTNILLVTNSQSFKTGISLGWQMVRRYVKRPPSLQECVDKPEELEPPTTGGNHTSVKSTSYLWSHKSRLMWLPGLGDGHVSPPRARVPRPGQRATRPILNTNLRGNGSDDIVRPRTDRRPSKAKVILQLLLPPGRVIFCILPLVLFTLMDAD